MGTMYVVKRVLGSITSVLKGPGSAGPLEVENSGTLPVNVYFKTTHPGDTQVAAATPMPVTAASLPLPSGAATSALQGGGLPAALGAGGGLKVDGSGTALPVSGTFWQTTQPVSGTVTADQGTAGAAAWPVKESWTASLVSSETDNDSDVSFTVPASTEYQVQGIRVELVSTATAGNRQITVLFTDAADDVVAEARAGTVQAASLTRIYQFGINAPDMTAFRDTTWMSVALPFLTLPAGYKVRVYDSAAIDAAADDMVVQMMILSRSV